MKQVLSFVFILISVALTAQGPENNKNYKKANTGLEAGKLLYADKAIDKCLADPNLKDNPLVLLLKSKIQFAISNDKKISYKYPAALKEAVKYAEKSIEIQSNPAGRETFIDNNKSYFTNLIKANNEEAIDAYNLKRYAKALPLLKRSLLFGMDTMALVYIADCYWELGKKSDAVPLYKQAAELIYNGVLDSNVSIKGFHKEPFRKLGQYYIDNKFLDSAYIVVKNGREILPNDVILNQYTYGLMRNALDKIPPSYDYLGMVNTSLKDFPSDSFLNHRENSIYIFLLNSLATNNEQHSFDSLLNIYANSKASKMKLKNFESVKRYDIFAGQTPDEFINNLQYYFAEIGLRQSCYATWRCKFNRSHSSIDPKTLHTELLTAVKSENNTVVAEYIFQRHLELYPKQTDFSKGLCEYTSSKNKGIQNYKDLLPLIRLNDVSSNLSPKNPEFKTKSKTYRLRLVSESSDSGDFKACRNAWEECSKLYPDQSKVLRELWKKMVKSDYIMNYYGSRINLKGKTEPGIPEYVWNGQGDSCKEGSMPDKIALRVEQRINYFRRMAGLTEMITLTRQDNEMCMFAVMMCESNKSMSHEPGDGWRCYVPAGADALKTSILSSDGNPAIAIVASMGHNHASVGNRRWLLYPKALYMGIGTSKKYSAIKAVDESRQLDTLKYKKQFVAWPPAKDCPKMMVFKKWSFSMDKNLKGATVTMKDQSGADVPLKLENPVNGYGLNTLVWEPQINTATLPDDSSFSVTVKLADGSTYQYTVNIIDVAVK